MTIDCVLKSLFFRLHVKCTDKQKQVWRAIFDEKNASKYGRLPAPETEAAASATVQESDTTMLPNVHVLVPTSVFFFLFEPGRRNAIRRPLRRTLVLWVMLRSDVRNKKGQPNG